MIVYCDLNVTTITWASRVMHFLEAVLRCKIQIYFLQPRKHYDNIHWAPEMLVRESHSYHTGCKILYMYLHCEQLDTALYGFVRLSYGSRDGPYVTYGHHILRITTPVRAVL